VVLDEPASGLEVGTNGDDEDNCGDAAEHGHQPHRSPANGAGGGR
jgi:hypothetical protein